MGITDVLAQIGLVQPSLISPYPSQIPNQLASGAEQANTKLQQAILDAVFKAETDANIPHFTFPIPFTIVDISQTGGPFPVGGWQEWEEDYIASEAKIGVMYAAYAFRDMVDRYARSKSIVDPNVLFSQIAGDMNLSILNSVPALITAVESVQSGKGRPITDVQRLPTYSPPQKSGDPINVVTATTNSTGTGLNVTFSSAYDLALENMIVVSDNSAAKDCIHGLGYSYLNGALAAGSFFDAGSGPGPVPGPGLWVGGDYTFNKANTPVTVWPYARLVTTANDGNAALATSTRSVAYLMALIATQQTGSSGLDWNAMFARLGRAAQGEGTPASFPSVSGFDPPWISQDPTPPRSNASPFPLAMFTAVKIGVGNLKNGAQVLSEVSVVKDPITSGHQYVLAWQNLIFPPVKSSPFQVLDLANLLHDALTRYET